MLHSQTWSLQLTHFLHVRIQSDVCTSKLHAVQLLKKSSNIMGTNIESTSAKSGWWLKQQCTHSSHFTLFLNKDFKVLINNCHCKEDSSAWPNGTQEVSQDGQCPYTQSTEGCCSWDVTIQLTDHWVITMTSHYHLLLLKLFGNLQNSQHFYEKRMH